MWHRAHMEDKMHFEVILIVLLVVMCIAGLVMWTRLAASNKRTTDAPAGEPEEVFRGGIMCRYVVTSGSLVRLELFDWGIRLRGTPISRWVVPTWEARYDELAIAELVALPASRIAAPTAVRRYFRCLRAMACRSTAPSPGSGASTISTSSRTQEPGLVEEAARRLLR